VTTLLKVLYIFIRGDRSPTAIYGTERRFIKIVQAYEELGSKVFTLERYPSQRGGYSDRISFVRIEPSGKNSLLSSLAFSFLACVRGLHSAHEFGIADVIVSGERNFSNVFPALFLSATFRRPFAVVLHHAKEEVKSNKDHGGRGLLRLLQYSARRLIVRRASLLIAVSDATRDEFARAFQISRDRFLVSGNGVEALPIVEIGAQRSNDVLYVGRFHQSKGIHLIPPIWKKVTDILPGAKMIMVGGYGNQLEEFKKEVCSMSLGGSFEVRGYVSEVELGELFASSKVFVLPSQMEGFSLATAQALAYGCVCVVSDLPALRSVFGESVIYAPPADATAFANAIVNILQDQRKLNTLSKLGFEFSRRFDWNSVATRELIALQRLIRIDRENTCPVSRIRRQEVGI
jgi:glycosyltransferase involved in cell wall biosynthesis